MNDKNNLREHVARIILNNNMRKNELETADELITLIRTATLDEVKEACELNDFDDRSFYLLCKAIDNLRGEYEQDR